MPYDAVRGRWGQIISVRGARGQLTWKKNTPTHPQRPITGKAREGALRLFALASPSQRLSQIAVIVFYR